jgi:ABC-type nitrate/sulfonate/bicarbonate transport system permease component
MALQESAEAYLVSLFEDTNLAVSRACLLAVVLGMMVGWWRIISTSKHPINQHVARTTY